MPIIVAIQAYLVRINHSVVILHGYLLHGLHALFAQGEHPGNVLAQVAVAEVLVIHQGLYRLSGPFDFAGGVFLFWLRAGQQAAEGGLCLDSLLSLRS